MGCVVHLTSVRVGLGFGLGLGLRLGFGLGLGLRLGLGLGLGLRSQRRLMYPIGVCPPYLTSVRVGVRLRARAGGIRLRALRAAGWSLVFAAKMGVVEADDRAQALLTSRQAASACAVSQPNLSASPSALRAENGRLEAMGGATVSPIGRYAHWPLLLAPMKSSRLDLT